jgi:hypothetical protein
MQPQNPRPKQRRNRITPKHTKKQDGDTFSEFLRGIPCRERVDRSRDVPRLSETQQGTCSEEPTSITQEDLECRDKTEDKDLCWDPFAGADLVLLLLVPGGTVLTA